jgi:hypothetical protein
VLIVTGTRTATFHRRINAILADALPDVERVDLDAGHDAPTAQSRVFLAALRAFLARHP